MSMRPGLRASWWRAARAAAISAGLALAGPATHASAQEADPWPDLRASLFKDRPILEDGLAALEAPTRAEDAALVPITLRFSSSGDAKPRTVTLIVDQNPAPIVATFTLGEAFGDGMLSTRVRVNAYSNIHAVVETSDGALHLATKFVKAAGGCSAPAAKDQDQAQAELGKMQFRAFEPASANSREAQIMVRHPNHSGMQMDQVTGYYIPARIVDHLEARLGDRLIFRMEGGLSLSENPNIRFTLRPEGPDDRVSVTATDSDGGSFEGSWPLQAAGG